MSVRIEMTVRDLDQARLRVARLSDKGVQGRLMDIVAALGESQTRRRIEVEKTAPDGSSWPANLSGTSTLFATGRNLRDSIASEASQDQAVWGASWEFAHVHQNGATIVAKDAKALRFRVPGRNSYAVKKSVTIPARRFVGVSDANEDEIIRVTEGWLRRVLQ